MLHHTLAYASEQHRHQKRLTGEAYIHHPISVMETLEDLGLTGRVLECALLHDVCEDTQVTYDEVKGLFGDAIGSMVYYLTKDEKGRFECSPKGHDERLKRYLEKFEEGIIEYPEIMLIKMSDQLDNLETLVVFPSVKQERIVSEIRGSFLPMYQKHLAELPENMIDAGKILYRSLVRSLDEAEVRLRSEGRAKRAGYGVFHWLRGAKQIVA